MSFQFFRHRQARYKTKAEKEADKLARTYDGYTFDSKAEMGYYMFLKNQQSRGLIGDEIFLQVQFEVYVRDICTMQYTVDFIYFCKESKRWIYDEFKGYWEAKDILRFKQFVATIQSRIAQPRVSWQERKNFRAANVAMKAGGKGRLYLADRVGVPSGKPIELNVLIGKRKKKQ